MDQRSAPCTEDGNNALQMNPVLPFSKPAWEVNTDNVYGYDATAQLYDHVALLRNARSINSTHENYELYEISEEGCCSSPPTEQSSM